MRDRVSAPHPLRNGIVPAPAPGQSPVSAPAPTRLAPTPFPTRKIGLLGFDGLALLDLTGPLETFTAAQTILSHQFNRKAYDVRLIGLTRKSFLSASNLLLSARHALPSVPKLDTLIIPGGLTPPQQEDLTRLSNWLVAHASQVRRIVAVCGGIYPLAQSGLLDGRIVTTHWRFAHDMQRRFPKVHVDPTIPFIKDGRFYSCGAGTAAIEMSLGLIEEDYGTRLALSVARELVMRLRPPANTENLCDASQFSCGATERFADLPAWIGANLDSKLSVKVLAQRVSVCPRHFRRLFKEFFHVTPAAFVERLRINEAGRRLRLARSTIDTVAAAVGFRNVDTFRRAFKRHHGSSPKAFRKTLDAQPVQNGRVTDLFAA